MQERTGKMRTGKSGKLAALQKERTECETLMKTFCLDPSNSVFCRVNRCDAVRRGEFYHIWLTFVPYHGSLKHRTGLAVDSLGSPNDKVDPFNLETVYNMQRGNAYRAMILKLSTEPTKTRVLQLLYVFAATGWFQAIEKFYECMGDGRLVYSSRVELMKEYKQWREMYVEKVREYLSQDKDHFTSRGIDRSVVDFSRFDVYQTAYDASL